MCGDAGDELRCVVHNDIGMVGMWSTWDVVILRYGQHGMWSTWDVAFFSDCHSMR